MSGTGEEMDPMLEARAVLAAGHAIVRELAEEGVSEYEQQAPPPVTRAVPDPIDTKRAAGVGSSAPEPTSQSAPAPAPASTTTVSDTATTPEEIVWRDEALPDLEEVRSRLGECTRCGLCSGRTSIVFGDGDPSADLMFIGEGPGEQEDLRGLPFVGRAGELLTQMIEKGIGISRSDVYICNIVKCRPPRNRNPLPPEVSACRPFLDGQILAVKPKVIVTLGKPAASLLLDRNVAITQERGTWQEYRGIPLMPTLHPAYVLRQYTAENRRAVWQDLQAAIERTRA
jgi:uracil-DNA glycosylase family 4